MRPTQAAETEIGRCWQAYKKATTIIAALLVIIAGVGTFLGIKTVTDIRDSARNAATNEVAKVQVGIKKELEKQFAKDTIQKTINDTAKERIDLVADRLIQTNVSLRISPLRTELLNTLEQSRNQQEGMRTNLFATLQASKKQQDAIQTTLLTTLGENKKQQNSQMEEFNHSLRQSQTTESNLVAVIAEANDAVRRLNQDSEFVTKAILADHDDRSAFEQLIKWQADSSSRYSSSAALLINGIRLSYYGARKPWGLIHWNSSATNRYFWDIEQINIRWSLIPSAMATDFIDFVWANTNTTKEQRILFLRNAYLKDSRNSLQTANSAADLVSKELGARYNPPFDYSEIENRWVEYSRTNHLFAILASGPTNMVYDIITPSSTNRIMILRDWGNTKLLLFKLEYPAVADSVEAMDIDYSNSSIAKMQFANYKHLNTVAAYWDDPDSHLRKYEFRYQRDVSKSNVRTISVTTNSLILDDSVTFSLPAP